MHIDFQSRQSACASDPYNQRFNIGMWELFEGRRSEWPNRSGRYAVRRMEQFMPGIGGLTYKDATPTEYYRRAVTMLASTAKPNHKLMFAVPILRSEGHSTIFSLPGDRVLLEMS